MPEIRHLAFDLGAESGRAVVGTLEKGILRLEEIYRFPTQGFTDGDRLRWDINRFFNEIKKSLNLYNKRFGPVLESIGVDTWGVDFGLLDGNGELLETPCHYRDKRTLGTPEIIDSRYGNERLYERTGIQLLSFNTLNQLVAMKRDEDPVLDKAVSLLFIGDLLHYFLTGVAAAEFTVASISQLYNPSEGKWDEEILETFDLSGFVKTPIIRAGEPVGVLKPEIAAECGIDAGTLVIAPAVHDTASAAAIVPATGDDWAYISSGTWSIAGLELDRIMAGKESYDLNISNSGGVLGKNLFLKNVMGLWVIQQCRKYWQKKNPGLDYDEINRLASEAEPFTAFVDLDDDCFLNPDNMPATLIFCLEKAGQKAPEADDIGRIARIVYENLAFKYRAVFDKLKNVTSRDINTLHVIGGGSMSVLLNQLTADALNLRVLAGPVEGSAIGNILMQSYGCGHLKSHNEIREVVRNSFPLVEFTPEDPQRWNIEYEKFKAFIST